MTDFIHIMEIIGTVAFAVSGALVAIGSNLDIFGVVFVSCITAVGGGILRDMLLGVHPPYIFVNYHLCIVAMTVAIVVFIIAYFKRREFRQFRLFIESVNNIFDAFGLAAFTVTGAEVAYTVGYGENAFIVIAIGMITGVGGGIFRDVFINKTPYVLKKHVYAMASVLGGVLFYFCKKGNLAEGWSIALPVALVVAIRIVATERQWSLPKIQIEE
ncbi:MAG: trimeric intracellular cation channel family protein [Clostridia bacterium]|nr:trimeric intracellular cation channel family protein [Clostridia bacterium]